jgi:hypothetical protein
MGGCAGLRVQFVTYRHMHQLTLEQHISRRVSIAPEDADLHPSSTQTATDARLGRVAADRGGYQADQLSSPGAARGLVARTIIKPAPSLKRQTWPRAPQPAPEPAPPAWRLSRRSL